MRDQVLWLYAYMYVCTESGQNAFLQEQIITGEANNKVAGGKPIWNKSALAASGAARHFIIVFAGERERERKRAKAHTARYRSAAGGVQHNGAMRG